MDLEIWGNFTNCMNELSARGYKHEETLSSIGRIIKERGLFADIDKELRKDPKWKKFEKIMAGRHPHCSKLFGESEEDCNKVTEVSKQLKLLKLAKKNLLNLSGGEKQRVAIATLFAQDPSILLLDEPCNHLDIKHRAHILNLIRHMAKKQNKIADSISHMM